MPCPGQLLDLSRTGRVGSDRTISRHTTGLPGLPPGPLQLTSSERRVLYYLTTGGSAQEIADEIVVSLATVRSHIRSVLRKLGVRSQLAAVALANRRGLVPVEAVRPDSPAPSGPLDPDSHPGSGHPGPEAFGEPPHLHLAPAGESPGRWKRPVSSGARARR